ncbi:MAG: hypothetical protein HYY24_22515 [Verrucomicrobia bacterium]|nr:hypothetical protein [Verrucomicrobiota bacterium]
MRVNWKWLPLATLLAFSAFGAGCSGINTSGSVSPATFFLPGLGFGQTQPAEPRMEPPSTVADTFQTHSQTN